MILTIKIPAVQSNRKVKVCLDDTVGELMRYVTVKEDHSSCNVIHVHIQMFIFELQPFSCTVHCTVYIIFKSVDVFPHSKLIQTQIHSLLPHLYILCIKYSTCMYTVHTCTLYMYVQYVDITITVLVSIASVCLVGCC